MSTPEEKILKKYPPMKPEELEKAEKEMTEAKTKYNIDQAEVEKALTEYLEILDPLMYKGKAIAYVRRPSMKQLKALIPPELREYVGKQIPEELAKKHERFFYEKMSEMIAVPEYDADQWETKANPWFIRLFWQHINDIANLMEGQIEGF